MSKKLVTEEMVNKALASLDAQLGEDVSKASESDLDQPEGADLGNPVKEKMSDAAKGKKTEKSVEKEEKEESDEESEDSDADDMGKAKKSMVELPEEIQEKIDVSEFLKSLVSHTSETIDALGEAIQKSEAAQETRIGGLSAQISEIQKSQAKIGLVLKALCEKAGILSSAPARVIKSETQSVAKSDVAERSFAQEVDENPAEEKMFKSLSENPIVAKGQMTDALIELVKSNACSDMDLINFESTNFLRPEVVTLLKSKLN